MPVLDSRLRAVDSRVYGLHLPSSMLEMVRGRVLVNTVEIGTLRRLAAFISSISNLRDRRAKTS